MGVFIMLIAFIGMVILRENGVVVPKACFVIVGLILLFKTAIYLLHVWEVMR